MHPRFRVLAFLLLLPCSGCQSGPGLESLRLETMDLEESFREPARTRLPRDWVLTMPVTGRIGPILQRSGDAVGKGQEITTFDRLPLESHCNEARASVAELEAALRVHQDDRLERTALADAQAAVKAAREALKASDTEIEAERKRSDHSAVELRRKEALYAKKAVSESERDEARLAADTSLIELRRQEFYRASLQAIIVGVELGPRFVTQYLGRKQLEGEEISQRLLQARARLQRAEHDLALAEVRAPVDGIVLERLSQGDRLLEAGSPLLRLGCLKELEVVAEVLTEDALRIRPGTAVELRAASHRAAIRARVRRIDAAAFTKISSLGVEQQRVRVFLAFEGEPAEALGEGYRLQARFITDRRPAARALPRYSVLQDVDGSHSVFVVEKGLLAKRKVRIGLASERHMEILEGLSPDEDVLAHPDATMAVGEAMHLAPPTKEGSKGP